MTEFLVKFTTSQAGLLAQAISNIEPQKSFYDVVL